ncbi:MAG: CopG family antitoxin [Snowella sp.]|nr:CopG family antitoxin [Snowella sp.]
MNKPLPQITTDQEAEQLLDQDLSEYLNQDNFYPTTFEFAPKNKSITIRMSSELVEAIKKASQIRGISYQRYIREAIERALINS